MKRWHVDHYAIRRNCVSAVRIITEVRPEYPPRGQAPVQALPELPQRQVTGDRAGYLTGFRVGRRHQREPLPAGQRCENMVIQRLLP